MKGMIVKSRLAAEENTQKIAIPGNLVNVTVNVTRYEGAHLSIGGFRMPGEMHLTWNGGKLMPGDEIEIEFTDIDKPDPTMYEVSHAYLERRMALAAKAGSKGISNDIWQQKLERYHRLKSLLESEKPAKADEKEEKTEAIS